MSGVLKTVGKIAGVLALIPSPIQPIAAVVAVAATIGASLIGTSAPAVQGNTTAVQIGANMPSPMLLGEAYFGGNRVAQVAYGTDQGVPNAHLVLVDVFSVGGPLQGLVQQLTDFTPVTFSGTNAVGYFHNFLYCDTQLGATPEATALTPFWTADLTGWGAAYKLSGKAAILWNAKWPKDGKVYASGFPQTGAIWQGVLCYDPRLDDTYPGGSGSHRWADPKDKAAFSAAKATWAYSRNPGLHALRYALGTWERDETNTDAEHRKVFGIGGSIDQIAVADFVELANVCDANSWTVNGVVFEPGDKWANLKRILMAGGAEPTFDRARLGLKINAPRVSLDTITMADIGEGEPVVPGTRPYSERKNTLTPYFISKDHKWQSQASSPVQATDFLEMDGSEKGEDWPFDLVQGGTEAATQAAQLTGYELFNRREQGPITMPLLPRLRGYKAGVQLSVDAEVRAYFGIQQPDLIVLNRGVDPDAMQWTFGFVTETAAKHPYALALTGTSPPAPAIVPPSVIDGAASGSITIDEIALSIDSISITADRT